MESVGRRHHHHHQYRENPSFSSSLLDQIYRSIDIDTDQQQVYSTRSNYYGYQYHQQEKVVVRTRSDFKNTWHHRTSTSTSAADSISISISSSEAESASSSRPKKPIQYNNTREKQLQGKFVNTKSRAMKIYGDLKHPISPGGRLATFLISLFTNLPSSSSITRKSKSASSFSQTPSSKPKLTSVRDCRQPYGEESNLQSLTKMHSTQKNHQNLLKNYQRKVECGFDLIRNSVKSQDEEEEEYDDDDGSHTSSDLFELENFSSIGMDKYRDELPVYETTHLDW